MRLVEINETTTVSADAVSEVTMSYNRDCVEVVLRNGNRYAVRADYGASIYDTHKRLVRVINEALK